MKYNTVFLIPAFLLQMVYSLKIMLHSDFGGRSHIKAILEITRELQNRDHQITYVAIDDNGRFLNEYKNMSFISLGVNEDHKHFLSKAKDIFSKEKDTASLLFTSTIFNSMFTSSYKHIFPQLKKIIENEQPDVIICDFFSPSCRDAAELNEIPLITGLQTTDAFGINDAKYLTHGMDFKPITTETLSFLERFNDAVVYPLQASYYFYPIVTNLNKIRYEFGVPKSSSLFGDLSRTLGIANTFVGFEPAVATPPNIKQIGPIMSNSVTPLTKDLVTFLGKYKKSLYVAFGSNVMLGTKDIDNIVYSCLNALEQGIINGVVWGLGKTKKADFSESFQFNGNEISRDYLFNHPQFRILEWAPQEAILNHPSTVIFLSHGGLESTFEGIVSKTPILCMAFLGDQPRNAKKLELAGIGTYINRKTIDPLTMADKMSTLLNDPILPYNLERMSSLANANGRVKYAANLIEIYANNAIQCRPSQPFIYGKPGCEAAHLVPVSHQMNFIKANQLDVYFVAILIAVSTLLIFPVVLYQFGMFIKVYLYSSSTKIKEK